MNQEQVMAVVRMLLTTFGSILATKGVVDATQVTTGVDIMMTAIGSLMAAGTLAWSLWAKTHANTLNTAAALPNVQKIITTSQVAADAAPSDKVIGPPAPRSSR